MHGTPDRAIGNPAEQARLRERGQSTERRAAGFAAGTSSFPPRTCMAQGKEYPMLVAEEGPLKASAGL